MLTVKVLEARRLDGGKSPSSLPSPMARCWYVYFGHFGFAFAHYSLSHTLTLTLTHTWGRGTYYQNPIVFSHTLSLSYSLLVSQNSPPSITLPVSPKTYTFSFPSTTLLFMQPRPSQAPHAVVASAPQQGGPLPTCSDPQGQTET